MSTDDRQSESDRPEHDEASGAREPEGKKPPNEIHVEGPVTIVVEPARDAKDQRGSRRADDEANDGEAKGDENDGEKRDGDEKDEDRKADDGRKDDEEKKDGEEKKGHEKKSRIVPIVAVVLVALAAIVAVALWIDRRHATASERDARAKVVAKGPKIQVVTVKAAGGEREVTLPGEVRGYEQTTLYAKLAGFLRTIRVDRGDRVKKDQILAIIESPENDQDVAQALSDAEVKRVTAVRMRQLASNGVASTLDVDNATNASRQADAVLGRMQTIKGYEVVKAPFSGVITARYVDPGALLPAATGATQSAQPVVDLARVDKLRVFVYLGQDLASLVRAGDVTTIWADERPKDILNAEVTRTTDALDPRTRTMQTEIDVDNADGKLMPGTFVRVRLTVQVPATPEVPNEALVFRFGKDTVAEVKDGHVHFREVEIAGTDGRTSRVARGLDGGETIAVNVPIEVDEGAAVETAPAPAAEAEKSKKK